jgi:hypothetical protein
MERNCRKNLIRGVRSSWEADSFVVGQILRFKELRFLLLLQALQFMMNLSLFYDCSPLVPSLLASSPISKAHYLKTFFSRTQRVCLLVEYPLVYVELTSCNGSVPEFQKAVLSISTDLLLSLSSL